GPDLARRNPGVPRPAAGRLGDAGRDARRGGHTARPLGGVVGRDRVRGLPEVRGREPDGFVQGPWDDRRDQQGCRGGRQGGRVRLHREHQRERRRLRGQGGAGLPRPRPLGAGGGVVEVEGNFDASFELARGLAERYPVTLVNSVNPYRLQGQKTCAFESVDALGRAPDGPRVPGGNAGNISSHWIGYSEYLEDGVI